MYFVQCESLPSMDIVGVIFVGHGSRLKILRSEMKDVAKPHHEFVMCVLDAAMDREGKAAMWETDHTSEADSDSDPRSSPGLSVIIASLSADIHCIP